MKSHIFIGITATAATLAIIGSANPAHAFSFGTSGIQFDTDTTVTFNFVESHGAFQSALHVFEASNLNKSLGQLFWETKQSDNGGANEWLGSFGNAVASASGANSASFTFKGGVAYTLGLLSGKNGTVYSTSALNANATQQAVFGAKDALWSSLNKETTKNFAGVGQYQSGNVFSGPVLLSFDDRGNKNDTDFQDFAIQAQAEAVPEPLTMAGVALAGAGLTYVRRRRQAVVK